MPEAVWKDKPRDAEGRVLLGIDSPTLGPVLQRADKASTRERMLRAKFTEGGEENLAVLAELVRLRQEYARLFGMKTFADFQMRRRMIGSTAKAQAFLDEVRGTPSPRASCATRPSCATPRRATSARLWPRPGSSAGTSSYYSERLRRERYSVDQEAFRPHFPPEESLRFVMKIAERLFGVRYTPVPATLWHPDARACAGDRCAHRQAAGDALRRSLSARRQVRPCRGLVDPKLGDPRSAVRRRPRWWPTSTARA